MDSSNIGQRKTSQRDVIVGILNEAEGPLTPQEILDRSHVENEKIGIATVYRTIKILLEMGDVKLVNLPDGQSRYESSNLKHHHHFKCKSCNKIFDLESCSFHLGHMHVPDGFQVDSHEITLFGLCSDCKQLK